MITQAKKFAEQAHAKQKYGEFPYLKHLNDVVSVLIRFGVTEGTLLIAAYLHDTVEDTPVKIEEIKDLFGEKVSNIVAAVTNEPGINRKERNLKTYPKVRSNNEATILKLADRIANVEFSVSEKSSLLHMYKKEYAEFKRALQKKDPTQNLMWEHLDKFFE